MMGGEVVKWLERAILILTWLAIIPVLFVVLFVTIEVQSSAKNIPNIDPRTAGYTIENLAHVGDSLSSELYDEQAYLRTLQTNETNTKAALNTDQAGLIQSLLSISSILPAADLDANACQSSPAQLTKCYNAAIRLADTQMQRAQPEQKAELVRDIQYCNLSYGKWIDENNNLTRTIAFENFPREDIKNVTAKIVAAEGSRSDDPRSSVVHVYIALKEIIPGFKYIFIMPTGVVVALFTGVMGSIGAAVRSLFNMLNPVMKNEKITETSWQSFGVRPMLGALAGFVVYFVISAGASFLVQPTAADATTAVNNLSPSALASLGIFAGLAAEDALEWLIEKAKGFFSNTRT